MCSETYVKLPKLNTREKVVITSQAGEATGRNRYWFKAKIIDAVSLDFSKVKDWDYLEKEVLINNITESDKATVI